MLVDRIKYFMPEWDDRYDLEFNFIDDSFSTKHKANRNTDVYAHEMMERPPYDGILYSLGNLFSQINKKTDIKDVRLKDFPDIKAYYHLNNSKIPLEVLGDCGAFNYVNEQKPPINFSPSNVAYLYNKLKFDYGVSVDHLVVETIVEKIQGEKVKRILTPKEKKYRIKLSLQNADEFLKTSKNNKYIFTPIGSAQGYSPRTYKNSVLHLIEMGYDYIALGGLARRDTKTIFDIVKTVSPVIKGKHLHLLGIIRKNMDSFRQLGVTSVDSASFFRKAWLRSGQNYLAPDGATWYTALRVPILNESRMDCTEKSDEVLTKHEKHVLDTLRAFDLDKVSLDTALNTLIEYDSLFQRNGNDGKDLQDTYKRTLEDKPWKMCGCPFCREIGIDVMIFRRTNRNKRRGLHNTWVLYNNYL